MTISFDLDDTLIPGTKTFSTERQSFFQKVCGIEPIRLGTIALMKQLQAKGYRIFVYTTSLRSPRKIWWTFFTYGIRLDKIINQDIHERKLEGTYKTYSKYPPAFNIDIHIDDSRGVEIEGERFSFKTIIVDENPDDWVGYVLDSILKHTAAQPLPKQDTSY